MSSPLETLTIEELRKKEQILFFHVVESLQRHNSKEAKKNSDEIVLVRKELKRRSNTQERKN
jgi:hypothetical protein